jgi:hypothetical protein
MSEGPPTDTTYCRECGAELGRDRQYCTECGAPQGTAGGRQQPGGSPQGGRGQQPGTPPQDTAGGQQPGTPPQDTAGRQQPGTPPQGGQGQQPAGQQAPPPQGGQGQQPAGQQAPPPQGGQGQQPAGQQAPPPQNDDGGRSMATWAIIAIGVVVAGIFVLLILAPVVAAFVLGLGDTGTVAPQASFDYSYTQATGELTVTHVGGDAVDSDQVTFVGAGFDGTGTTWEQQAGSDGVVTANDEVTLTGVQEDFELEIRWSSENDGDTSIISARDGPAA